MTIDIVIPHYREAWEVGRTCFEMIALQRLIHFEDIHVYLVQDGDEGALPAECFEGYPYRITQVRIPHSGVSAARNAGMDAGTGDWVMFCDFDDSFFTTHTLFHFFEAIRNPEANIVICGYESEERDPDGTPWAKVHDGDDYVLLHGKMFRRSWMETQHLRFDPELTIHEDSYFMTLARYLARGNEIVFIREGPLYATYWNEHSVTRDGDNAKHNNLLLRRYDEFFRKSEHLVDELLRRGMTRHAEIIASQTLCDTYENLARISWRGRDTSGLTAGAAAFAKKYRELLGRITDKEYFEGLEVARSAISKNNDLGLEAVSFPVWMDQIRSQS